mmetsp:Transcript_16164/g.27242  ORF Transcript_16164/g.27242 Transcript_16164/m.27242 type:complete len:213 (+) Transcript_16164:81-719(+)
MLYLRHARCRVEPRLDFATNGAPIVGGHAPNRVDDLHPGGRGPALHNMPGDVQLERRGVVVVVAYAFWRFHFRLLRDGLRDFEAEGKAVHEDAHRGLLGGARSVALVETLGDRGSQLSRHIGVVLELGRLHGLLDPRANGPAVVGVQAAHAVHNQHPGRHAHERLGGGLHRGCMCLVIFGVPPLSTTPTTPLGHTGCFGHELRKCAVVVRTQ